MGRGRQGGLSAYAGWEGKDSGLGAVGQGAAHTEINSHVCISGCLSLEARVQPSARHGVPWQQTAHLK